MALVGDAPVVPGLVVEYGLTGWGYLPGQWRLANVAYPLLLRQGRVNDGGGSDGASERPPSRIFQAPTQAPNATTGQTVLSRNTV